MTSDNYRRTCGHSILQHDIQSSNFPPRSVLMIWDYVTGTWGSWAVDKGVYSKQVVAESTKALLSVECIVLWLIPPFSKHD